MLLVIYCQFSIQSTNGYLLYRSYVECKDMSSKYVIEDLYIAKVVHPTEYYPITKITLGGPNKLCIAIDSYEHSSTAYMSALGYNRRCNMQENLIRGDGTKHLMRISLAYVLQTQPTIEGITLRDDSKIVCVNGKSLKLYYFCIAVYGKTWYEKHFGAKLEDKKQRDAYRQMKAHLQNTQMLSIIKLYKLIGVAKPLSFEQEYVDAAKAKCSYAEFFKQLHAKYDDCSIFTEMDWFDRYMSSLENQPDFHSAYWIVKRSRVGRVGEIKVEKVQGTHSGGGARVQKPQTHTIGPLVLHYGEEN